MDKKYKLTDKTKFIGDKILKQIIALRDINNPYQFVKKGETGGYVESEKNLSHEGECWIFDNACISEEATINCSACVRNFAYVHNHAIISGYADVSGMSDISGFASLFDKCVVSGDSVVSDFSLLRYNAEVANGFCNGIAKLGQNAFITSRNDYITIGPIGSRNDYTTFYKTKNDDIWVSCGCFNGSIEDFEEAVKKRHLDSLYAKEYCTAIEMAKMHIYSYYFIEKITEVKIIGGKDNLK